MTTPQRRPSNAPLTGTLSGTGHDMFRATVYTRAVPSQPPRELTNAVHPVHDSHGDLQDWRLGSLLAGHAADDDTWSRFRQWRAGFAQDRFLGERALVQSFLDWLEPRCDISALGVLRLANARVDFHTALRMEVQIEAADRAVQAAHEDGLGLYTSGGIGSAIRVLIPTQPPTPLLGLNATTLTVGAAGLNLLTRDPVTTLHGVTGWRFSENAVRAAAGGREIDVTGQDAERLLLVLGRQARLVNVHPAPLRSLLAPLLVFLRDVATLAGTTGTDLHLRSSGAAEGHSNV